MKISIQKFAKGKRDDKKSSPNAVIYTRVSSTEQKDGYSLGFQETECVNYAKKQKYRIKQIFGQTSESAKTDNRKEFNRMLNYIKEKENDIQYILVYKYNRFSRTGSSAIQIIDALKTDYDIHVISVTEPSDPSTPSGVLQQAIMLSFSRFDNDVRRELTVKGMIERMRKGLPCGQLPVGYVRDKNTDTICITEEGKLVREGFELYRKGYGLQEISNKIGALGLKKSRKSWNEILKNPLYCGYISNSLLNGDIVRGNFVPIISEEIFMEINERRANGNRLFAKKEDDHPLPLKVFTKCTKCGTPFTGYKSSKKNLARDIFYYKCNNKGCGVNVSSEKIHSAFQELLREFTFPMELVPFLREQLCSTFSLLNNDSRKKTITLKSQISGTEDSILRISEKFVDGKIPEEIYEKLLKEKQREKANIERELIELDTDKEITDHLIDQALQVACESVQIWVLADTSTKKEFQNLLFPEGATYDKEKNEYRTTKVNQFFELSHLIRGFYEQNKTEKVSNNADLSSLVAGAGLEPATFGL